MFDAKACLARLPKAAANPFKKAFAIPDKDWGLRNDLYAEAAAAVGLGGSGIPYPLAETLDEAQWAFAEIVAHAGWYSGWGAPVPRSAAARRRWLGLDPPGVMEQGKPPLWRRLQEVSEAQRLALVKAMPVATRLRFVLSRPADYDLDIDQLREAMPTPTEWNTAVSPALLDEIVALLPQGSTVVPRWLSGRAFLAAVTSRLPIEPRWDVLFPRSDDYPARELLRAAKALVEPRRSAALICALSSDFTADGVGLKLLEQFPSVALARYVLDTHECQGDLPRTARLARLRKIGERHPVVAAVASRRGKGPLPPVLAVARRHEPKRLAELSPVQRAQFAAAQKFYSEPDDREPRDWFLRLTEIVDAAGAPAFDLVGVMSDSGTVFVAGTTKAVGSIVHFGLECRNAMVEEAINMALYEESPAKGRSAATKPKQRAAKAKQVAKQAKKPVKASPSR